jgi:hypothetical protein
MNIAGWLLTSENGWARSYIFLAATCLLGWQGMDYPACYERDGAHAMSGMVRML